MKIYTISELYADYKHTDCTVHSAHRSFKEAKKALDETLMERYNYMAKDSIKEKYRKDDYSKTVWEYDDGNSLVKFYIDELDM